MCFVTVKGQENRTMLFEPKHYFKQTYGAMDEVVQITNGRIPIRVVNFDIKPHYLYSSRRIGKIFPLQNDIVANVNSSLKDNWRVQIVNT